jgi:hypothetical protein
VLGKALPSSRWGFFTITCTRFCTYAVLSWLPVRILDRIERDSSLVKVVALVLVRDPQWGGGIVNRARDAMEKVNRAAVEEARRARNRWASIVRRGWEFTTVFDTTLTVPALVCSTMARHDGSGTGTGTGTGTGRDFASPSNRIREGTDTRSLVFANEAPRASFAQRPLRSFRMDALDSVAAT